MNIASDYMYIYKKVCMNFRAHIPGHFMPEG